MPVRWTVRRTQARRAVIAALGLLTALTTFLLTGIAGYSAHTGIEGLRHYLTAPGSGVALAMQTRLSDDPKAQQAAAEKFFARSFAGVDVQVFTSLTLPPQPVSSTSVAGDIKVDGAPTLRLASFDDFLAHATVTAGAWPADPQPASGTAPQPAALSATAATTLGLHVGDTVSIGTSTRQVFQVVAVWTPTREGDPFFEADAAAARSPADEAADQAAAGFLVAPRAVIVAKGSVAQANWTVVPDPGTITPESIPALAAAAAAVPQAFRNPDNVMAPHGGLVVDQLSGPLLTVSDTLAAARSVNPVPSLLVAAIALVMTVQLARLLAIERRRETALVRSRGASAAQLTRIATVEAAAITVPAALLGAVLAAVGLHLVDASWPAPGWWIWLAVAIGGAAVIVLPAAHQARTTANRQNIDDSGRIRALAAGSTVALVLIAAAVSLWRFRHLGSAVVLGSDGTTHLDPIAVLAPALVLIAAAVVAGVLFGLLAALVETAAAGLHGIGTVLAARQVARRATVYGIAVLLLAISVGGTALAASYASTQLVAQQQTDVLRNGGSVQVQLPSVDPMLAGEYAAPDTSVTGVPGVRATVPAVSLQGSLGAQAVDITGVPSRRLPEVLASSHGFDVAGVDAALRGPGTDAPGAAIPDGTTELTLTTSIAAAWGDPKQLYACASDSEIPAAQPGPSGQRAPYDLVVWISGPDGWPLPVDAGTAQVAVDPTGKGTPHAADYTVALPHLAAGSRLVGLSWSVAAQALPLATTALVTGVTARTTSATTPLRLGDPQDWSLLPPPPTPSSGCQIDGKPLQRVGVKSATNGIGVTGIVAEQQSSVLQIIPTEATTAPLRIAIDQAAADLLDLSVGDQVIVSLGGGGRDTPATVAVVSPVLPGSGSVPKVLIDLAGLSAAMMQVTSNLPALNRLWITADDPAAVARAIRPLVPPTSLIQLADSRSAQALLTPASRTLWLGAIGAIVLAAIGVGSVIAVVSRSRRGELVALRASGITARQQARSRRRELFSVTVAGWLLGAGVGAVAVYATISALAGSTIVGSLGASPPIRWDLSAAGWLVGGQIVVVAAIVVGHGAWLRRAVLRATPSELQS